MGLQLTLTKENNSLYTDFPNAYWCVEDVGYRINMVGFNLYASPSREAKQKNALAQPIQSTLPFGSATVPYYNTRIYNFFAEMPINVIFPNGIPLSRNDQMTAIYNWIKQDTNLPFVDILE